MLLVYAVILGVAAGLATGGRLGRLGNTHIRLWPVALGGLAFQALLFSAPLSSSVGHLGPSLYVVSTTLVLMALIVNLRQPGFWLITLGALLNFVAVVANGGQMPASPEAVQAVLGGSWQMTGFVNSVPMDHAVLGILGDVFALPHPFPLANIFSIGDVLIGAGGALFVWRVMHGAGQRPNDRLTPARTDASSAGKSPVGARNA